MGFRTIVRELFSKMGPGLRVLSRDSIGIWASGRRVEELNRGDRNI